MHVPCVQGAGASASVPGETQDLYVVVLLEKNTHTHRYTCTPGENTWVDTGGACPQAPGVTGRADRGGR